MIDFPGIDDYFGAVGAQIWKTETINKEVVKYTWQTGSQRQQMFYLL